ncbi:MAG: 50S ribosomal protein L24 [Candidatus Poribacteria bacterium]|nr:MAG: 50S ribosomal protein L24 [Candidatus Poribacteria bacterium]
MPRKRKRMEKALHRLKLHVRKGDRVRVIAGEWKGAEGVVKRVFPETQRVIVEGVNVRLRKPRPTPSNPQPTEREEEFPIHVSNVKVLEPAETD